MLMQNLNLLAPVLSFTVTSQTLLVGSQQITTGLIITHFRQFHVTNFLAVWSCTKEKGTFSLKQKHGPDEKAKPQS